jgi:response regulator RpfG family c-di-GMP phosphodiesterase
VKPAVLLVDDEPAVLDGFARHLRGDFDLTVAPSGRAALEALQEGSFAVVVSDLRMPGLDGVSVLSHAQDISPDTVRILLTGQADLEAATRAVNLGQVFRILTKPVPASDLAVVLRTAVRQHQLQTAERDILEQTLRGAVQTLLDTLALANPMAFARATRVQRLVIEMLEVLEITDRWQIEVAAALSQLGAVTLPAAVAEKLHAGVALWPEESALVERLPALADRLLENIPRLETVRAIVRLQNQRFDGQATFLGGPSGQEIPFGARVLKVALDADTILAGGASLSTAVEQLESRLGAYDGAVLRALRLLVPKESSTSPAIEIGVPELMEGMLLVEDVVDGTGRLLVGSGQLVTESLIERVRNFDRTIGVSQPLHVRKPCQTAPS